MSAESTNIEKQTRRHPALWGMGAVVVFAAILLVSYLTVLAERAQPVAGEEATAVERALD